MHSIHSPSFYANLNHSLSKFNQTSNCLVGPNVPLASCAPPAVCTFGLRAFDSEFFPKIGYFKNPRLFSLRRKTWLCVVTRATGTNYYSTLKVCKNASLQEIKNGYRKLARKSSLEGFSLKNVSPGESSIYDNFQLQSGNSVLCCDHENQGPPSQTCSSSHAVPDGFQQLDPHDGSNEICYTERKGTSVCEMPAHKETT